MQLHQLEEEERELLFRHRVDAVMTVAPFLLVVALPAAFLVYLLKHQSSPAALRSALVRATPQPQRCKQKVANRNVWDFGWELAHAAVSPLQA